MDLQQFLFVLLSLSFGAIVLAENSQPEPSLSTGPDDSLAELNAEKARDKRGIGLILSGLAQVFGYNVAPIQFASLPNPNIQQPTAPAGANPIPAISPGTTPMPSTSAQQQASNSTNSTVPRQRETLRFTGVVNFGNNSNIIQHLQQYERIFHGSSTTSAPTSAPTPAPAGQTNSSVSVTTLTKAPLLSPLLVQIPIPILPKIQSPNDFSFQMPDRQAKEMIYRNQENRENYSVESKEIKDADEVRKPGIDSYESNDEPNWKKDYEDRLRELERRQKEHAERLRQQENRGNLSKNSSDGRYNYSSKEKDSSKFDENDKYESEEHDDSKEKYDDYKDSYKNYEQSKSRPSSAESSREDDGSRENEENRYDDSDRFLPKIINNTKQLPISHYNDGKRKPEVLRDSYGEVLDNDEELVDERISSYYSMLKDMEDKIRNFESNENSNDSEEKGPSFKNIDFNDERFQKIRQEFGLEPSSKYEEYEIDNAERFRKSNKGRAMIKNENATGKNAEKSNTFNRIPERLRYKPNPELQSENLRQAIQKIKEKSKSYTESDKTNNQPNTAPEELYNHAFAIVKNLPYVVPIKYGYSPEHEVQIEKSKLSEDDEPESSIRSEDNTEPGKPRYKEVRREQPKLNIVPAEKGTSKKFHEGEQKAWPAPFDYSLDSTEQTNVVLPNNLRTRNDSSVPKNPNVAEYEHYLVPVGPPPPTYINYAQSIPANYQNIPPAYPQTIMSQYQQNVPPNYQQNPQNYILAREPEPRTTVSPYYLSMVNSNDERVQRQQVQTTKSQPEQYQQPQAYYDRFKYTVDANNYRQNEGQVNPGSKYYLPNYYPSEPMPTYYGHVAQAQDRKWDNSEDEEEEVQKPTIRKSKPTPVPFGKRLEQKPEQVPKGFVENNGKSDRGRRLERPKSLYSYNRGSARFDDKSSVNDGGDKKEEVHRRNELENKMTEILENLKTRLLVE